MTYEDLINTVSEITNNPNIKKEGLSLTYELPENIHIRMNKELFYKMNQINNGFTPSDIFEVEIGGLVIKFIKK
jgi:hypothetical protein